MKPTHTQIKSLESMIIKTRLRTIILLMLSEIRPKLLKKIIMKQRRKMNKILDIKATLETRNKKIQIKRYLMMKDKSLKIRLIVVLISPKMQICAILTRKKSMQKNTATLAFKTSHSATAA